MSVGSMLAVGALACGLSCLVLALLQPRRHRDRATARADMRQLRAFLVIGIVLTIGGAVGIAVGLLRSSHTDEVRITVPAVELTVPDEWTLVSNDAEGIIISRGDQVVAAVTVMVNHAVDRAEIAKHLERFTSEVPGLRGATFDGPRTDTKVAGAPAVHARGRSGTRTIGVWAIERSAYRVTLVVGLVPQGQDPDELQYVVNGVKLR